VLVVASSLRPLLRKCCLDPQGKSTNFHGMAHTTTSFSPNFGSVLGFGFFLGLRKAWQVQSNDFVSAGLGKPASFSGKIAPCT
jgi:hypothetical protein